MITPHTMSPMPPPGPGTPTHLGTPGEMRSDLAVGKSRAITMIVGVRGVERLTLELLDKTPEGQVTLGTRGHPATALQFAVPPR